MPLYVRLRGPQIALYREKREYLRIFCPDPKCCSLLSILPVMFVGMAFVSVGFFFVVELKLFRTPQWRDRFRDAQIINRVPHVSVTQGDFFKVHPLLNVSAPNVELSTQLILNRLYSSYNREDILNYYDMVRCRGTSRPPGSTRDASCKNFTVVSKTASRTRWHSMKTCQLYPAKLKGRTQVWNNMLLPIERIDKKVLDALRPGGWWEPEDCLSGHSVALVIPYKDRWSHLTTLLNYLHPMLQRQQIRYKIFVVEQYNNDTFNKGVLMNAAFIEALKEELYHCFIFHDVDMIPETDHIMYSCPDMPRHLSVAVNEFNYFNLPYFVLVGGVFAIRTDHYFKVNGFSNLYWGWGAEDDDMGLRVLQSGLKITRPLPSLGRYTMIQHVKRKKRSDFKVRKKLLSTARKRYRLDGLNSVQYTLIGTKAYPWYTKILVDVGKPHPIIAFARGFANGSATGMSKKLIRELFKYKPFRDFI